MTEKLRENKRKLRKNKLIQRKKHKIREIQRQIELQTDFVYLEFLKHDLKLAKNHSNLQRKIWKRDSWREYTC